jgi:hypothetical protein
MAAPETTAAPGTARIGPPDGASGPEVVLPFLLEAWVGNERIDAVAVDRRVEEPFGPVVLQGRGQHFDASARWTPVTGPVPHWAVALEVRHRGRTELQAGIRVALRLPTTEDPGWCIPGLFYGENRPAASRSRYPRFTALPTADEADPFTSAFWAFRADRCATPVVMASAPAGRVALATMADTPIGLSGVGFSADAAGNELRLHVPYREEPVVYTGAQTAGGPDLPTHRWAPGATATLAYRVYITGTGPDADGPVLRDLHAWLSSGRRASPWVDQATAAGLAAEGLLRWHDHPGSAAIYETIAFERGRDAHAPVAGDRAAMHVGWLSGAPVAAALLAHGRRAGDAAAQAAGRRVLDAIVANLAPCGTFWGQWSAVGGWGKGWTPGPDSLHARTLAEAALFLARATAGEEATGVRRPAWRQALVANLAFVVDRQRPDGALPSAWNGRTGKVLAWEGTAGLAWVPALVEGSGFLDDAAPVGAATALDAARRAGTHYAAAVEGGTLSGAPEDVDLGPTSEDGYVAVMAYVALAEAEAAGPDRDRWLTLARRAADWMLTFRYTYDVAFPATTLLGRHGYRSLGMDQASPANQHLHTYGLICVPEMVRLSESTGDPHYLDRTRELLAAARQFIARDDGDFGARRGMTPERFHQTAYGGPHGSIGPLSHAWCLGLLLWACDFAADRPELADAG